MHLLWDILLVKLKGLCNKFFTPKKTVKAGKKMKQKNSMKMKLITLTLNVLQLSTSRLSMHKLVALTINLEDTQSRIKAPVETQITISNDAFANVEILQSCHYQNKGGVSLLIRKNLSFCGIRDLKMNEVDAFWSMINLECFLLLVA